MESKFKSPRLRFILLPLAGIIALLMFIKLTDKHIDAVDKDVLVIGVSPDFPPFSVEKNKEIIGFDIDLMNAIALEMKKKIKYKKLMFRDLFPAVLHNEVDIVISGLTPNPQRTKEVAFTKSYWHSYLVAVTLARSNIEASDQLSKDKKLGVILDSNMAYYAQNLYPDAKIITESSNEILLDKLRLGSVDAIIAENTQLPFLVGEEKIFNILPISNIEIQSFAFAMPKDTRLINIINKNIDLLNKNGKIQALAEKWNLINEY